MVKVGIIGFGKMGMLHGALANSITGMKVIAVTEKSKLVGIGLKTIKKDIKVYTDYKKMIDKNNLDAVIITTPTFNHFEISMYAAQKKLSIFLEKPITRTYQEAKILDALVTNEKIISTIGFHYRFFPTVMKAKELISSGALGNINTVKAQFFSSDVLSEHKGWRFDPEISGGGVLIDFGIHLIDMLQWFFGKIKSVSATKKKLFSKTVEDEVAAHIVFDNNILAEFETSWSRPEYRKPSIKVQITGEKSSIVLTEQTIEITTKGEKTLLSEPDLYEGSYIDIGGIAYSLQMYAFYQSIISKHEHESNIGNACYVHKILDMMYRSAALSTEVDTQEK